MTGPITDAIAWLTVGLLTAGALAERFDRSVARYVASAAWLAFAGFWALLVPHFAFVQHSFVEGAGSLLAVPGSVYVAYLLFDGRDSLLVVSRAVAVMGLLYLPFALVHPLREFLVEFVSAQAHVVITTLGYDPAFTTAEANGFHSAFVFTDASGHRYATYLVLACTGIGSMSIMAGLIAVVDAPLGRRARAIAVVIPTIWALNLVRVAFIAISFGNQWFQVFVDPIMTIVGYTDPHMVSYFVADRVLAQGLSVVALLVLVWFVARDLPELLSIVEEVLYVFTNREYDLQGAFAEP